MEIIHEELGERSDTSLPPFLAYSMNGAARVSLNDNLKIIIFYPKEAL